MCSGSDFRYRASSSPRRGTPQLGTEAHGASGRAVAPTVVCCTPWAHEVAVSTLIRVSGRLDGEPAGNAMYHNPALDGDLDAARAWAVARTFGSASLALCFHCSRKQTRPGRRRQVASVRRRPLESTAVRCSPPVRTGCDLNVIFEDRTEHRRRHPRCRCACSATTDRVCNLPLSCGKGRPACPGHAGPDQGTMARPETWRGRTLAKSRRFTVATVTTDMRSQTAITDASVPPSRRSA